MHSAFTGSADYEGTEKKLSFAVGKIKKSVTFAARFNRKRLARTTTEKNFRSLFGWKEKAVTFAAHFERKGRSRQENTSHLVSSGARFDQQGRAHVL